MFRFKIAVVVEVAEASVGDSIGPACLMIKLSVPVDFGSVVVSGLVDAALVVLRSAGVVDRDDFHTLTTVAALVDCSKAAGEQQLRLRKGKMRLTLLRILINHST